MAIRNLLCWTSILLLFASGCFGYRIGTRNVYRTDVRTINVPVIRSDSFRPELGVLLTEAVQKETRFLPPGEITHYFAERTKFVPEAGQSIATSFQRNAERLANHIVDQMETRW